MSRLPFSEDSAPPIEIAAGAFHLRRYLPLDEQRVLADACLDLGNREAGFYTPVVRGGRPMSVRMLCLGRHWNARRYAYEDVRGDVDGNPVPELPIPLKAAAARAAAHVGFDFIPDICIVNWYGHTSRMGLHQDKDESADALDAGYPVVSFSIGDSARFLFGGLRRRDPIDKLVLESGDVFVFGGPARLRYHGVTQILPGTAPAGLPFAGRLNLTFRKF